MDKEFTYLSNLGYTGTLADKRRAYYDDLILNGGEPNTPSVGEIVPDRELITVTTIGPGASGTLMLTYFTAKRTETITTVTTVTGGTAAGATPTLCRIGVYSVDSSGNLTLVASIANDTALWAATNTVYSRTFTVPFSKTAGQRYAAGLMLVTGAAVPLFVGTSGGSGAFMLVPPAISTRKTGLSDLPASIAVGDLTGGYVSRAAFQLT